MNPSELVTNFLTDSHPAVDIIPPIPQSSITDMPAERTEDEAAAESEDPARERSAMESESTPKTGDEDVTETKAPVVMSETTDSLEPSLTGAATETIPDKEDVSEAETEEDNEVDSFTVNPSPILRAS